MCPNDTTGYARMSATATAKHAQRIETIEGMSVPDALQRRYFDERTPAHVLCTKWGMQYRAFRRLCAVYGVEMKTPSAAIREQWIDAPERRKATSDKMKRTMANLDLSGDNNPAKRPEVRAKISQSKKLNNAAKRPEVREKMSAQRRAFYAAHPEKHPNRFWGRYRRSKIERMMDTALQDIGIHALQGQRIGRRWPDLVIPDAWLVVECDGRYWHTPEVDAARDAELQAAGWSVLHFTDEQIVSDAAACALVVAAWMDAHADAP